MKLAWRLAGMVMASAWLIGCERIGFGPFQPAGPAPQPLAAAEPAVKDDGRADYMANSAVRGDQETPGQGAVDIALEWSKKYAKAAEDLLEAQKANKELREENKKLLAQTARLQMQLEQSQKELSEANEMLVELGRELREWKSNVLGFRSEMQQAQQVQMEAIKKILVLLGGEPAQQPVQATDKPTVSSKDAPGDLSKGPNS